MTEKEDMDCIIHPKSIHKSERILINIAQINYYYYNVSSTPLKTIILTQFCNKIINYFI